MNVLQDWVSALPMMQQTVLLTAVRGPDGIPKYHSAKYLLRWYRRCILLSAMDGRILTTPYEPNGGSFTGPSIEAPDEHGRWRAGMDEHVTMYLRSLDEIPLHFHLHLIHAVEIVGYKHPDMTIGYFWLDTYKRFVKDFHMEPEFETSLDERLGDNRSGWLRHGDIATND